MIACFERRYVTSLSGPEVSGGVSAIRTSSRRSTRTVRLLSSRMPRRRARTFTADRGSLRCSQNDDDTAETVRAHEATDAGRVPCAGLLVPAAVAHRALGGRDVPPCGGDGEDDSGSNSASENPFSVCDLAFELSHRRDIDGDATAGELGWRRVCERDPDTEHRDIVNPALPFAGLVLNATDSVPAGTEALHSTVIRHYGTSFLPAGRPGLPAPQRHQRPTTTSFRDPDLSFACRAA